MTTTEVNYVLGGCFVRLHGHKTKNCFFKQLIINENENSFEEKLNDKNYKRTVMKLHDAGWKNNFSFLMKFPCLVLDVVCIGILNFKIKI